MELSPSARRWAKAAAAAQAGAVPFAGVTAEGLKKMMKMTDLAIVGCRTQIRGYELIVGNPRTGEADRGAARVEIVDTIASIAAYGELLQHAAAALEASGRRDRHGIVGAARDKAEAILAKAPSWAFSYGVDGATFARLQQSHVSRLSGGML